MFRLTPVTLVALLLVAGCAPAVQLRVPAYQGEPVSGGRLLVVRGGGMVATEGARDASRFPDGTSFEAATWEAFLTGLTDTYTFTSVRSTLLPDSLALTPVFISSQVVTEGRAENRWQRHVVRLPAALPAGAAAEFVLVLDTVRVDRRLGTETGGLPRSTGMQAAQVALTVLVGPRVAIPQRGLRMRAAYALYRVGTDIPIAVGELESFGIGPNGVGQNAAWTRSVRFLAQSLARELRIETR